MWVIIIMTILPCHYHVGHNNYELNTILPCHYHVGHNNYELNTILPCHYHVGHNNYELNTILPCLNNYDLNCTALSLLCGSKLPGELRNSFPPIKGYLYYLHTLHGVTVILTL